MLSQKALNCKESPTLAISSKAKAMKKQGLDVIDFGAGQPDFEPTGNIKKAIINSLDKKGYAKYTPASGKPELKQAISDKLKRENNIEYTTDQILVSCGAKHSLYNIMQALVDKGDEVIIPSPYWVSYPEQVNLADGTPVIAETDENFKIKSDKIKEKITGKTKIIIINSPSNPTGAVIDDEELKKIAELAVEKGIYVISDEIYENIIYDKKHISIASLNEDIKKLTLTVNGISKSYAMPGLRIGYTAGPAEIIKAMSNIQAQSTSNPTSIIQDAAIEALNGSQEELETRKNEFRKRRDFIVKRLNEIGLKCSNPDGAFYVFPHINQDSINFANKLLEEEKVAVVPGVYFGKENYIRISYAASMEQIEEGIKRIEGFVK
ncbi:MAG: pyridoxal phosphate-dependent aminotransferase [Nanoarchaeota archaeon]|nr:pyridoxal phosphate-dependent aminotransferase [Nanoarchaeota archaeon]